MHGIGRGVGGSNSCIDMVKGRQQSARGGHIYTCCTDTRDRDQSEIKRSSYKIGDDQAIKTSICTAQIKVKMGPVFDSTHAPPTPGWQSTVKALLAVPSSDQGPKMAPIKF